MVRLFDNTLRDGGNVVGHGFPIALTDHVGKDLAAVGVERCCDGDSAGVGTAAAQRGDVVQLVQALEACHDDDAVALQLRRDALGLQFGDAGLGVGTVGAEACLPAGQTGGMAAQLVQSHSQQGDTDLILNDGGN